MRATRNETTRDTINAIRIAIMLKRPVTISYRDAKDDDTVRTIEPYEVNDTMDGDVIIVAMCRMRGDRRTFRLDRVTHYTVHRGAFYLPELEVKETSFWTISSRSGVVVARVRIRTPKGATSTERYEAVREVAMKLPKVRAISKAEGGYSVRREADHALTA